MRHRSPAAVLLLPFITLGIYSIYWQVSTKGELNKLGANIPTAWLLIVPIANIWWLWKYSEGAEQITKEKISGVLAFLLLWLLGFIGQAILQDHYNKLEQATDPAAAPPADMPATEPPQPAETVATEEPTPPTSSTPTA